MPNKDVVIWPLYSCVEPSAVALLIQYQYDNYGQKLDIMTEPPVVGHSFELEPLEEIEILIRERRPAPRGMV